MSCRPAALCGRPRHSSRSSRCSALCCSRIRQRFTYIQRMLWRISPGTALLERNPFPDKPPIYVRAQFYDYDYTYAGQEEKARGQWWNRRSLGLYFPVVHLRSE
jgi:hypothetical protein